MKKLLIFSTFLLLIFGCGCTKNSTENAVEEQIQEAHAMVVTSSPAEAFKDAFEHEQFISGKVNDLMAIAREEREYSSEPLLDWFINEQVEEEASTSKIADELEMAGDDRSALLMLDRELGTRVFPAGSPLDPAAYNAE